MKRLFAALFAILVLSGLELSAQASYTRDTISMTPGYAEDVFYSMTQGEAASVVRSNWDIAFRAYPTSASILVNDGGGAELYTWPGGDLTDWATVDTNGLSTWTPMYNSSTDWEEGAFTRNATGHPDYGWGIYNSVTHNLTGDSIFIVKTVGGTYLKLAILSKQSLAMVYTFQYAMLDGSADSTITINAATYSTKNFIYYSLDTHAEIDREPASADWDIMFTKYLDEVAPGSYYPVTGVLQNNNVLAARYEMGDTASVYWELDSLKFDINNIGWDWKAFSMTTFSYEVDDSMYFFVLDLNGDLYKLVFESFVGSSTGEVTFRKALISPSGIGQGIRDIAIGMFPNPSSDIVTLQLPELFTGGVIRVFNNNGQKAIEMIADSRELSFDVSGLTKGMYVVEVSLGNARAVSKLIVR